MGNSQQRREELLQYQPHLINYTLHHTHSPLSIYRHLYSSQEIMEHREIIYHFQDIDRKLQTFYSRYQHLFLVSTQYLKLQAPNACSDGSYEMRTFYQRVITNLSKVNDIPFNDSLYCYSVALKGFEILFRSYGYFQVFENMFHICHQGKLKVWCNQHIYKSVPEQYLLGNGREQDMVKKVISIIDQNIERTNHQINIKQILMCVRPLTFANARFKFMEVCNHNQFFVTQYLESLQQTANIQTILDIYTQYQSKNKLMQPYDTGLTFNPKKNSIPNFPRSSSQDCSVRRSSLLSSRLKNQTPSEKRSNFDEFNKKNKRIQIMNIALENQNKQDGFPSFSNKELRTGRKSSQSQQNLKYSRKVYQRTMSPYKYEKKQELSHQVASIGHRNTSSPQSRLKKTASRQNGRDPNKNLFQSSVNQIKDGQLRNSFNPQDRNIVSRTNRQIRQEDQYYQTPTTQYNEPPRIYKPQQYVMVRPYSQNRRITTEPQSSRTSQTKTIRVNLSPQPIRLAFQQMSPKWTNPAPQNPITSQLQTTPTQQNSVMYPIYPMQKVMYQVQPESSRLRKVTKIQAPITFSQQKSENNLNNQSQIIYKQTLPTAYVQHEKRAQIQFNQRVNLPLQQLSAVEIQNSQINKSNLNIGINGGNISHKIISNKDFIQNNEMRIVDRTCNNYRNAVLTNMREHYNMKFLPVNRRVESLPTEAYPYEQYNKVHLGNVAITKQLQPLRIQKLQNLDNTPKSRVSEKSYEAPQPQKIEHREVRKEEKLQLPQIQSKIDMLSSFAENKITTFDFLPNQSHAVSGIKWQKGQNSGRDSVSSAFRKELFPQNNSLRQFQKKHNSVEQKNFEANKKQSNGIKANHDYLQTDPKLIELIKNATSNYKKELVKTVSIQNKQTAIIQSYGKKDSIKQYNTHQVQHRQSRFKTLPQKKQNTNQMSSLTATKAQSSNYAYGYQRKTEIGAFKKKNQPYVNGNKISAISQKWDEENICSTSNGSISKNYLQNLDADILQDMYAYGMEGKGRFK